MGSRAWGSRGMAGDDARELSDGTMRYLYLLAALFSPRPPSLIVLNEPESSLHPDLILPLGQMIADAALRSQVVVVTHSDPLAQYLHIQGARLFPIFLDKGETKVTKIEDSEEEP